MSPIDPALYPRSWLGWLICTVLTCCFGLFANALLLTITLTYRKIRDSSSAALILHCTAVDLYLSVVVAVDCGRAYLGPRQWVPRDFCRFYGLWYYGVYAVHVWAACMLAFQRLVATLLPQQYRWFARKPVLAAMIALPWLLIVTIHLFPIFGLGIRIVDAGFAGGCTVAPLAADHGDPTKLFVFYTFFLYLPTALSGLFYVIVLGRTWLILHRQQIRNSVSPQQAATTNNGSAHTAIILRRRLEISRTLFLSFVWFCMSQYPLTLAAIFFPVQYHNDIALNLVTRYLIDCYSCLNPVRQIQKRFSYRH